MQEVEFQDKVIKGVDALTARQVAVENKQETLLKNLDSLTAETKKAMDELTIVKNKANSIAEVETSLKKVQLQLRREMNLAYGNPIERIQRDPDKRNRFNAAIRLAIDTPAGDMRRIAEPLIKAIGEDATPGSTFISTDLAAEIYDVLSRYGSWATLGVKRLGTKTTTFPVKTARAAAGFVLTEGSGQIGEDSTKAGTSVSCTVEVIAALLSVSVQLLQDSEFDVTSDVMNDFEQAFNYRMDYAAFQGDGSADATHGGFTGILNYGTAAAAAAGNIEVQKTDLEDWVRCLTTVAADVLNRRGAGWWIHPHLLAAALSVKDANHRPIFQTANEAPSPGAIGSILGFPVRTVNALPTTNAASAKVAAFGDPEAMVVGIRSDWVFEASDHHKWDYLQRCFRGYGRVGIIGRAATGFAVLTLPAA
jgi:HK97 family phage major capsid protein